MRYVTLFILAKTWTKVVLATKLMERTHGIVFHGLLS